MDDKEIEAELQAKGLNAPRITPQQIDAQIVGEHYHVPPGTTLTLCVLTLANGFAVTGESACASPTNFDEAIGRRIAREKAREKIWALEGYRLRCDLAAKERAGIRYTDDPVVAAVLKRAIGKRGKGDDVAICSESRYRALNEHIAKIGRQYMFMDRKLAQAGFGNLMVETFPVLPWPEIENDEVRFMSRAEFLALTAPAADRKPDPGDDTDVA